MNMQKGFEVVNLHGTASGIIAVPTIGENGNWWIGNEDTGVVAQGPKGEPGSAGEENTCDLKWGYFAEMGSKVYPYDKDSPSQVEFDMISGNIACENNIITVQPGLYKLELCGECATSDGNNRPGNFQIDIRKSDGNYLYEGSYAAIIASSTNIPYSSTNINKILRIDEPTDIYLSIWNFNNSTSRHIEFTLFQIGSMPREANIYSADETAIGKWVDGKTIYRKIINYESINMSGDGITNIPHGITALDNVIDYNVILKHNVNHNIAKLPYIQVVGGITYYSFAQVKNDIVEIYNNATWTNYTAFTIIEYTKRE